MKKYEKPLVVVSNDLAEGVFAASGAATEEENFECQSPEMGGNYMPGNTGDKPKGFDDKKWFGCKGCPADRGTYCALKNGEKVTPGNKDFRPDWERNKEGFVNTGNKPGVGGNIFGGGR